MRYTLILLLITMMFVPVSAKERDLTDNGLYKGAYRADREIYQEKGPKTEQEELWKIERFRYERERAIKVWHELNSRNIQEWKEQYGEKYFLNDEWRDEHLPRKGHRRLTVGE